MTSESAPPRSLRAVHAEAGLIGKAAVLWIVILLLVGLLLLDGLSIVLTTFKLSNTAQAAATTAATAYKNLQSTSNACTAAQADLLGDNVPVPENGAWCKIDPTSGVATITLKTEASSLILGRLSFSQDLTKITVKETAEPSSL
jgi:hypothetical protein